MVAPGYFNVRCWDLNGEMCFFHACLTFEQAQSLWARCCEHPDIALAIVYHWPEWIFGYENLLRFQREGNP